MGKINNITGRTFGKLTAVRFVRLDHARKAVWIFQCECGNQKEIRSNGVLNGTTISCGCFKSNRMGALKQPEYDRTTHGMSYSRVYCIYKGIIQRCTDVNTPSYKAYGDLGVCSRWLESFENFYEDMGEPPTNKHSIDRIDNSKGYSKENCRWADHYTQSMNRSTTVKVEYNSAIYSLAGICRVVDLSVHAVRYRMNKKGMSLESIIPGARLL